MCCRLGKLLQASKALSGTRICLTLTLCNCKYEGNRLIFGLRGKEDQQFEEVPGIKYKYNLCKRALSNS